MKKLMVFSVMMFVTLSVFGQTAYSSLLEKSYYLTEFTGDMTAKDEIALRMNSVINFFYTPEYSLLRNESYSFVQNGKLYNISYDTIIRKPKQWDAERDLYLFCWDGTEWKKAIDEPIQTDYFRNISDGVWEMSTYIQIHGETPFEKPSNYFVDKDSKGNVVVYLVCRDIQYRFYYKKLIFTYNKDQDTYSFSWNGKITYLNTIN